MQLFDSELCVRCKGRGYCGNPCKVLAKIRDFLPKTKLHFSGSSPPEIFVGRIGYPLVNTGILAPQEYGDNKEMSLPEIWYEKNLSIKDILNHRGKLIYSRFQSKIKSVRNPNKFQQVMQEISLADKSVSAEIFLKKPIKSHLLIDKHIPIIGNPAPLKSIRLEENPKIKREVDYIVSDTDNKSAFSIKELYKSKIEVSNIIKILSAGMLGLKSQRKLVPTRWSVTCVDSTISKSLMQDIRNFPLINEYLVFSNEYIGNHYEILLIPRFWSFEVIEAYMSGNVWNPFSQSINIAQDYEGFYDRKDYAENVGGGYYSPRVGVSEYLTKIKRQASVLVLREAKPSYYAPCGVGILRETVRGAFAKQPNKFNTLKEAFKDIQKRFTLPIKEFIKQSKLLKNLQQTTLKQFI